MSDKKFYTYALLDSSKPGLYKYGTLSFDFEPFYIGKGCGNRIKNTVYDKSKFKINKINKLKKDNIDIIKIKISENLTSEEALNEEIIIIELIGRRDLHEGSLVNTTDGGDGRLNSKHSYETKCKISKNRKGKGVGWRHKIDTINKMSVKQTGSGNGFYNKKHTNKIKETHSIKMSGDKHPMYNNKHSEDSINKMRIARSKLSNDTVRQYSQKFNKEVNMYTLDMKYIKTFKSVKDASNTLSINESIISKCCRGDIINPTRYFFKYNNSNDNIKNNRYCININDSFYYKNIRYILNKRNKTSAICENTATNINETIRYKDCVYLTEKEINNCAFVELYLLLKNIDDNFKINKCNYIIYNNRFKINIHYYKSKSNFNSTNYINDYININIFNTINSDDINGIIIVLNKQTK